jgi:hypothetical protein
MTRSIVVIAVASLGAGCTEPTQCLGTTPSGACLRIDFIRPRGVCGLGATGNSSNVDVTRGVCVTQPTADGGTSTSSAEPFCDHNALLSVTNEPRLNGTGYEGQMSPVVVLKNYRIDYQLNECPGADVCPGMPGGPPQLDPIIINPGQTVSLGAEFELPLMPIRRKLDYVARGGTANSVPSYTAKYTLDTIDPRFPDHRMTMEGWTEFTVGNFDNCSMK